MFGPLGIPELLFILALALLIFGPRKLPEVGRTLGKGMAEFRKASNELKRTINAEVIRDEIRQNDPRRILREAIEEPPKKEAPAPPKADEKPAEESPVGTVSRSPSGSDGSGDSNTSALKGDGQEQSSHESVAETTS